MLNGLRQVLLAALCTVLLCISAVSAASAQTSLKGVALIIGQSKMFYRLYGAIFEDLGQEANIARAA